MNILVFPYMFFSSHSLYFCFQNIYKYILFLFFLELLLINIIYIDLKQNSIFTLSIFSITSLRLVLDTYIQTHVVIIIYTYIVEFCFKSGFLLFFLEFQFYFCSYFIFFFERLLTQHAQFRESNIRTFIIAVFINNKIIIISVFFKLIENVLLMC